MSESNTEAHDGFRELQKAAEHPAGGKASRKAGFGKGDSIRPRSIPQDEWDMRWKLAMGHISLEQFEEFLKKRDNDG